MAMVSCTCGRGWNEDEYKSCPQCGKTKATLAKLAGQTAPADTRTATQGAPSATASANTELDARLVKKLLNAQIATMNYTRVLALVVMLFLANAIFGGLAVAIVVTADPYDGPNPVLAGIVVLGWIATLIVIITRIVKAMSEARAAREST